MFTGIVQSKARVLAVTPQPMGVRLVIDRSGFHPPGVTLRHGESVCNSGVCLTIVEVDGRVMSFDVIAETLAKTTLGELKPGDEVNLEPSLTGASTLGGHFVQGHVDGVGQITHVKATPEEWRVRVKPPADLVDYIIPKGSVTIDGVSLTIASVLGEEFEVALIPTTLDITTLGQAKVGGRVNLEADILAKTVVHVLRRHQEARRDNAVTMDLLREAGF